MANVYWIARGIKDDKTGGTIKLFVADGLDLTGLGSLVGADGDYADQDLADAHKLDVAEAGARGFATEVTQLLIKAQGQKTGSFTDHSGTITDGGTQQTLMAANTNRKYIYIQNISDTDMWINFGTSAVADQPSIKMPASNLTPFIMEAGFINTDLISIICATTGKKFVAKEG